MTLLIQLLLQSATHPLGGTNGNATQAEIVRAFGISRISVIRYVKKFREEGIAGFYKERAFRKAHVLTSVALKIARHRSVGAVLVPRKEPQQHPELAGLLYVDGHVRVY